MRILLFNQFFFPDPVPTSQYLTDLAHALGREHALTAICSASSYSESAADKGAPPPVAIVRTRNLPFSRSIHRRIASYVTFLTGAAWYALRGDRPDIVLTLTTPPLIGLIGTLVKTLRGSRHVIWEMDVYPDIAIALGVPWPAIWLLRASAVIANFIYRRSDTIIVLGECMKQRLIARGVPECKLHVAENWADGAEIAHLPFPSSEHLVVLYSGNFGLAHDLNTVRDAIFELRAEPRFRFVFAGGGSLRGLLEDFCRQNRVNTVGFEPYCERADLGTQLAQGHIGLVTLNPNASGFVVPSKVYGIMAAGRPILFIGPKESEPARIIDRFGCGWRIEPGDSVALTRLLRRLAVEPGELERVGARSRDAFNAHYDRPIGIARILTILNLSVVPAPTAHRDLSDADTKARTRLPAIAGRP